MHGSLQDNAGAAFATCNTSEIKHLADKHSMMASFKFCGSNQFNHYVWSPTGELLFFDLPQTANIMDAAKKNKPLYNVPIPLPSGQSAWINQQKLAYPIVPHKDEGDKVAYIGLFDTFQHTMDARQTPGLTDLDELQAGLQTADLYFAATNASGDRSVHHMDIDTGEVKPGFSWLTSPVETFTFSPKANRVVIGSKNTVTVYQADTGKVVSIWSPASRGIMHPDGKWLALEHEGQSISVFYQRRWEKQKGRTWDQEQRRVADLENNLPSWYDPTVKLPTFSFVQLETGKRWELRNFFGHAFQWFPQVNARAKYFGSFILWGFEGKQVNRNVMLGDLSPLLFEMQKGIESPNFEEMVPAPTKTNIEAP